MIKPTMKEKNNVSNINYNLSPDISFNRMCKIK